MTIQAAVTNAAEYVSTDNASAELLEGYLALTDCVLSTIKGRAFITKSTDVNDEYKAIDYNIICFMFVLISKHLLGYKGN